MLPPILKRWVAGAESWHTFIDFRLRAETMAEYPFLSRKDDFYIELFGHAFEILRADYFNEAQKADLSALARGLEIYSLDHTKENFEGIDIAENLLLASGLYYLADFSASSWYLLSKFTSSDFSSDIHKLICALLSRNLRIEHKYQPTLSDFVLNGDQLGLDNLVRKLEGELEESFDHQSQLYPFYILALRLFQKFNANNAWKTLRETGLFSEEQLNLIINKNLLVRNPQMWDFFPSQVEAIRKGILDTGKTVSLQMPTSSGKTALCELVILSAFFQYPEKKILFLAPFRALASELKSNFVSRLSKCGVKSKVFYGEDPVSNFVLSEIRDCNLLISTPEKFISLISTSPELQESFVTVICDEGHLIDDEERGLGYELLLSKLRHNTGVKFIFLSAILPNVSEINTWLGGTADGLVSSEFRPVPISYALLEAARDGKYSLRVNPTKEQPESYTLYEFLSPDDYIFKVKNRQRTYPHRSNKALSVTTALKSVVSGPVALFTPSKGGSSGVMALATEAFNQLQVLPLTKPVDLSGSHLYLADLSEYFGVVFGTEYTLSRVILLGISYHHGDLPQFIRELIERSIVNGSIRLVICTNTLAEGVNLPIRTMVLHTMKRYVGDETFVPIPFRDIANIVGRAGRAGKETKGLVIATNPQDFSRLKEIINTTSNEQAYGYLFRLIKRLETHFSGRPEEITSELFEGAPEEIKRKLDAVDLSLLEMLGVEFDAQNFDALIEKLAESTFAYAKATQPQRDTLKRFFHLRGQVAKTLIDSGEYGKIKKMGLEPRLYSDTRSIIDTEKCLKASDSINPLDEELWDYIFSYLEKMPQWLHDLKKFSDGHQWMTPDMPRAFVIKWLAGMQYLELSKGIGIDIDKVLSLQCGLISKMRKYVAALISITDEICSENETSLSSVVKKIPDLLQFGFPASIHLDLIDIGFRERVGNLALGRYLSSAGIEVQGTYLESYLFSRREEILQAISATLPAVSKNEVESLISSFELTRDF